jgi:hypothetical protein
MVHNAITGWDVFMVTSPGASSMLEGWERVRELREKLKAEWDELWWTKYDDEVRSEMVASNQYELLFVEKGEVIVATRDFKPLSFSEILETQLGSDMAGRVEPDPAVGGWSKFIKEKIPKPKPAKKRERPKVKWDLTQHQRKGGYLNKARIWRKMKENRSDI